MTFLRPLLFSLVCASTILALPALDKRATEFVALDPMPGRGRPTGAAYFITNEPSGNYVVAGAISSYGRLSFNRAVSTRGLGARGNNPNGNTGPDGLFSQGSVAVSSKSQVLAVVNAGSDTVTAFSIDPRNPLHINYIGQPVSSEGEFPNSLAFNQDGSRLCVLNIGMVNGVHCYQVDKQHGLTAIPETLRYIGYNQTTPPTGPAGTGSQILFSEDNKKLLVLVKGIAPNPGYLLSWDVAADGSLSKDYARLNLNPGGMVPFSMNVIPGAEAILATDPGAGFGIYDYSNAKVGTNTTTGSKSSLVMIQGEMASCWSARSARTGNYYLSDLGGALINEVHVDGNLAGSVVNRYPLPALTTVMDSDVASLGWNDFLFVMQPNITSVHVMSLAGVGKATSVGTYDVSGPAKAAGLTISVPHMQGMATFVTQH